MSPKLCILGSSFSFSIHRFTFNQLYTPLYFKFALQVMGEKIRNEIIRKSESKKILSIQEN